MSKEMTTKEQKNLTESISSSISKMVDDKRFFLPKNYVVKNALESAFYYMSIPDKTGKNIFQKCSIDSIAHSLKQMCILGLNPSKSQCYFIPYGNKLQMQPSYLGELAILKRIVPLKSINAVVIYENDVFEIIMDDLGNAKFKHETKFENKDNDIKGAYCVIALENGSVYSDYMTKKQIYKSWNQATFSPFDNNGELKSNSTHSKFTEEMAKRTIIRRTCKLFLKSSSDTDLVVDTYFDNENENHDFSETKKDVEFEVEVEVENNQASESLDIPESEDEAVVAETTEPEKDEEQDKEECPF